MSYSPDETVVDNASALLLGLMESLAEGVAITNAEGRIIKTNAAFSAITGYAEQEANGQSLSMLKPRAADAMLDGDEDGWLRRRDGSVIATTRHQYPVRGQRGAITHHIAVITDLTPQRQNDTHSERSVHYDELTGLLNRQMVLQQLAKLIEDGQRERTTFAVLLIDLDRFKTFNDSLGHTVGDRILQEAAQRIESAIRRSELVFRQGGDKFVTVLPQLKGPEEAALVANNIQVAMARPISVPPYLLTVTASIGISLYPHDAPNPETLLRCADTAMCHAKEKGRNNYQFYTPALNYRIQQRMALETALRAAMAAGELSVHFQPQISLENGGVIGAEALLRWQRQDGTWTPPAQFIPVAEECGLIVSLGGWVLNEACRQRKAWNDQGLPAFPIAVNCSALQFRQANFKQTVLDTIAAYGLGNDAIELEITESILMDSPDLARKVLEELRAEGIRVAIDDFGTGYSSLAYLKRFPVDRLKIDGVFIRELDQDATNRAIVQSIITLADNLGMDLMAEGAETAPVIDLLAHLGCRGVQGYGICRPIPATALTAWILARSGAAEE